MSAEGTDRRPQLGTRLVGARWHHREAIDSTNLEALRLRRGGAPAGTVVVADTQTAGRGRLGRRWDDVPGRCLLMSVLLEAPARAPGMLTAAAALAAAEAVEGLAGVRVALKWPNDLLVDGRKLAGVLAEGPAGGPPAVGIGTNVNGAPANLPPELRGRATFISHEAGRQLAIAALADELAGRLDEVYHLLVSGQARALVERIAERDALAGRRVQARTGSRTVTGAALGWLDDGRLLLRDDDGREVALEAGEVTLL